MDDVNGVGRAADLPRLAATLLTRDDSGRRTVEHFLQHLLGLQPLPLGVDEISHQPHPPLVIGRLEDLLHQ